MGNLVSDVIEIGTFGLVQDPLGIEAGEEAAQEAAGIQAGATEQAVAERRRQFDITQAQAAPFREAGLGALQQQQALLGLSGPQAQQQAIGQFVESPGQQFIRERAQRNLLRNASAIGGLGGGNVRSALVQQGAGFAQQDFQNQLSRLGALAGQGQATTSQLGSLRGQAAGQIGQGLIGAGQARASGILGAQQVGAQTTSQLLGLGGQALGFGLGGGFA